MQDEDYKNYLKNHNHPKVRLMHFIGQIITIVFFVYTAYNRYWGLMFLTPLVVYPFAVAGHVFFGKKGNKPSFYKMSFVRAKLCDIKMFIDILKGNLRIW